MARRRPSPDPARVLERYRGIVDDWPALLDAACRPLPVCLWENPSRTSPGELAALLREDGLDPEPVRWRPGGWRIASGGDPGRRWWYLAGLCHIQEEASLLPVRLLDPRPGDRVLDLCSAPGGKTAEIAFALGNRGTVVANDVAAPRLKALRATLERLGAVNVSDTLHDGSGYPPSAGTFDRILVDAPCSAEGTLRRAAMAPADAGEHLERRYAGRQRALLRKAVALCAPGGRIVYSTCTFAPEENEAVVDAVLREPASDGVRLVEAGLAGVRLARGLTSWEGNAYRPDLDRAVRMWPHLNDTGGFFAAVLEKDPGAGTLPPREPDALVPAADEDWRPYTVDRFGFPETTFEPYVLHRQTKRGVHVVHASHDRPRVAGIQATGILLVKGRIRHPKLTTAGALLLGPAATRNAIDLEVRQVRSYFDRESISLAPGQRAACTGTGYVVVRYRGHALGTGLYEARKGAVQSLFPERWNRGASALPPSG